MDNIRHEQIRRYTFERKNAISREIAHQILIFSEIKHRHQLNNDLKLVDAFNLFISALWELGKKIDENE